jgi:hypothetical protein
MIRSLLVASVACVALSACGAATGTSNSAVPATEAEKTAMATEIATMMSDPNMMEQMFSPEAVAASMPDMSVMCAAVPADQAAACTQRMATSQSSIASVQTEMMDKVRGMTPQLMSDMGAIMARTYTGEELAAMHGFYSSPEGQSILQKQPQVMAEFMPVVMQRMQPLQVEMMQKLSERLAAAPAAPGATSPSFTTQSSPTAPTTSTPPTTAPTAPPTTPQPN